MKLDSNSSEVDIATYSNYNFEVPEPNAACTSSSTCSAVPLHTLASQTPTIQAQRLTKKIDTPPPNAHSNAQPEPSTSPSPLQSWVRLSSTLALNRQYCIKPQNVINLRLNPIFLEITCKSSGFPNSGHNAQHLCKIFCPRSSSHTSLQLLSSRLPPRITPPPSGRGNT
jgi:hypothetical protein